MKKAHSLSLFCGMLVLVLIVQARALVVNDTQSWGATRIENLSDGGLEVGPTGNLTITGRVDMDAGAWIRMSGGILTTTDTLKFPDTSGPQNVRMYIDSGTFTAHDIEHRGYDRDGIIYVGGGTLIVQTGYNSGSREYDPQMWLQDNTLRPAEGYEELTLTDLGGGSVQITTGPAVPKVSFSSGASGNLESVTSAFIDVLLSEAQSETVTVDYSVIGGSADGNGVDYNLPGGEIVFDIGETSRQIEITVIADGIDEDDETIIIELSNPSGAAVQLGNITQHTYTIIDPRPTVQFALSSSLVAEQDLSAQIAVTLSHTTDETATVTYSVAGGSATGGGVDYSLVEPNTLTFGPGQTAKTITISVTDDENPEGTETVELVLSGPTSARLGAVSTHILTISDLTYAPFPDTDTVGLWLFDEDDYPHTTLTDASEYDKADLCLMDGGSMVAGKYGRALRIGSSDWACCYAGFAGKVPEEELREADGTPSGLWGPTEGSAALMNCLAGSTWTIEMWVNPASIGSGIYLIDLGWAYDPGLSLVLSSTTLELTDYYAGVRLTCPTSLSAGVWQHVAFTYDGATARHFVGGVQQGAPVVSAVSVQPLPGLQIPSDREHESRGFEAMSYEQRRQNRFNFSIGMNRQAANRMNGGLVDEMRMSRVVRYTSDFSAQSFSRNYGAGALPASVANGPALLFDDGSPVSIPLDFGARKHVFIDDAIIDTMTGLAITMNQPYGKQEIIKNFTIDNSAWRPSVFDVDGVIHMAIPEGYGSPTGHTYLATSADGVTFSWQGTIIPDMPLYGSFFKDLNPNIAPAEQYKVNAFVANRGMYFYVSPDGLNWRRNETIQLALRSGGEGECYWDDQKGEYASFIKRDSSFDDPECADAAGRVAPGFWTDQILKTWPFYHMVTPYFEGYPFPSVTCEGPVIFDVTAATQVYRTRAIKYPWAPDVYLAFIWRYPGDDGPRHVDLGISRDGENWSFFATGTSGPWYIPLGSAQEELSLYGLIRRDEEIWQYIDEGGAHGGGDPRYYYRYRQRLDGFVSLDAGGTVGTATTLPLVFEGQKLELNVKATGYVKVAITDQAGTELPGFGLADCDTIVADSTAHQVTWNGSADVSSMQMQAIRLKFEMQNAKLYAFEFVDSLPSIPGDFDRDCVVDENDLKVIAGHWLLTGACGAVPDANYLVVHYTFDETSGSTAYDSSGYGNDGQVRLISTGVPTDTAWDPGGYDANGCINFSGNVNVVVPAVAFSAVNSAVTVSLWINGDAGVQPDPNWGMPFHGGNPTNDRLLHTHIPTKYGDVMFESGSYNAQRLFWENTDSADWEGQWNHYAFTLNSAQQIARIYHNGEKVAERTGASLGVGGIQSFHVGCGIFADETVFEYFGKIDDFRVYSYALSPDEVLSMYSGVQQSPADSPANLYFDEIIDFKDYAEFAAKWLNRCY